MLLPGLAALIVVGFAAWVALAWSGHAGAYAMALDGWRLGGTHLVEVTVVAEDRERLTCASDVSFPGATCEYDALRRLRPGVTLAERLSPFNTVKNQLLLGAGLWAAPDLADPLPRGRFTVVCNFHVLGVSRPALRWAEEGEWKPSAESVPTGTLGDCTIPR